MRHFVSCRPPVIHSTALGYSIISPIVNGLACATFVLFYVLYKYLFTWQLAMPPSGDSGGLFFPRAVQHVFVGLYVQQVSVCRWRGVVSRGRVLV